MEALMARNKKIPHDCERSHTGVVLREHNKDMAIIAHDRRAVKHRITREG